MQPAEAKPQSATHRDGLLLSKLHVPRVRRNVVSRTRLFELLDVGREGTLSMVTAPAGFGKTTLVSHWIQARALNAAWVSLDPSDDHPVPYWTCVIHSVQCVRPDIGRAALQHWESSNTPSTDSMLTGLLNDLLLAGEDLVLVLDDYHFITHPEIHSAMMYLLDHAPDSLHMVIASRSLPSLPVARLRASGNLQEIEMPDLRATPAETVAFLRGVMNLELPERAIVELERRAEGWLAGIQLASLSLRDNLSNTPLALSGDNRYVLDYLMQEVLERQPEDVQRFLLDVSVLERFNPDLCNAITGRSDSQKMLEHLEAENLFLIPLDEGRGWYRYHALFAELLRHQLDRTRKDEAKVLHLRAGVWFEREGYATQAIAHFLAGNDMDAAVAVIERASVPAFNAGRASLLMRWFEALPDEAVYARPRLCLIKAWLMLTSGYPNAIPELLEAAESGLGKLPVAAAHELRAELAALASHLLLRQGKVVAAVQLSQNALQELSASQEGARGHLALALGTGHYHLGRWLEATAAFGQANEAYGNSGNLYGRMHALLSLGDTERWQGHLREATRYYRKMIDVAAAAGRDKMAAAGHARVGLAKVLCEQYDLKAARDSALEGIEIGSGGERNVFFDGSFTLSLIQRCLGNLQASLETLDEVEERALHFGLQSVQARAAAFRAQLHLLEGRTEDAEAWLDSSGLDLRDEVKPGLHVEYMTLARLLGLNGETEDALPLLDKLIAVATSQNRLGHRLEATVLKARCLQIRDEIVTATDLLAEALVLAQDEGYVRPFAQELASLSALMESLKHHADAGHYAKVLLRLAASDEPGAISAAGSAAGIGVTLGFPLEPLSERELSVLRLLVAGMTNKQIARELGITVNTVKTHVRNIYAKLEVSSRARLSVRVSELRLLS